MQVFEFLNIIIAIFTCFALIELFKIKKKGKLLQRLTVYFISAFIMFTVGNFTFLSSVITGNEPLKRKLFELVNCLFSCAELIFFSAFLEKHQPSKKANEVFKKLAIVYFILFAAYLAHITLNKVTAKSITNLSLYLNIVEYLILFTACLRFFYSIMHKPIEDIPVNKLVLIIISSLFLYISVSLPFLIIAEKINRSNTRIYNAIFSTHYIVLLLVIISLTITIKSKKTIFYA